MRINPLQIVRFLIFFHCFVTCRSQDLPPIAVAKTSGAVRIGISMPKYEAPSGLLPGDPIRSVEEQLLIGSNVQIVELSSVIQSERMAEAETLACDLVLASSVTRKRGARFTGLRVLSLLNPTTGMASGIGLTRTLALFQSTVVTSELANVSSGIEAGSEVTFEYALNTITGTLALHAIQSAKAKNDGEDVVTPMIQQAVSRIVAVASR